MKNKLALIISLVSVAIALAVVGVGIFMFFSKEEGNVYPEFLTSHKWKTCDAQITCTESISFRENGEFSHSCGCGSPVGDYDLYDSFTYDSEKNVIKVKGEGKREIKVLYHDDISLFLEFDDGTFKPFINENGVDVWSDEYYSVLEILENAPFYTNIKNEKDGYLTLLPYNYDGDAKESFKNCEYRAPLAKGAKVHTLFVKKVNGEESYEYNEISLEGAFETVDNSMTSAFIDFNEKGEITTVIIYGATEIWE